MATLSLNGIRKEYGEVVALDDLSLDVRDGEFFVLLGPSGAGKTTTLKCIAGLETPAAGRVEIDGQDMTDVEPYDRNVAMAFENYALYPQKTVFENMSFPLNSSRHRVSAEEARKRVEGVAETLGIRHLLQRLPRELSGGQRQRVALGRVLVRPADVYLLDEPLSHLDAKLQMEMRAELRSLGEMQNTTSFYVSHDYREALALGDRIGVLREGRLIQVGTGEEVWQRPADTFVARTFGQPEINLVAGELVDGPEGCLFRSRDGQIEVPLPNRPAPPGTAIELGIRPLDLDVADGETPTDSVKLAGRVYVVERLGRELEVTVKIGENLIAVVTGKGSKEPDEQVTIHSSSSKLLLFEGETGRRIDLEQDVEEAIDRA
jgi:multiple sugar transport system ATP-binding protein